MHKATEDVCGCGVAGKGVQFVQRKKTIYPEWNTCFDAHLYDGRMIQMVVMQRPQTLVADVNIGAHNLADKCRDGEVASVWVSAMATMLVAPGNHM